MERRLLALGGIALGSVFAAMWLGAAPALAAPSPSPSPTPTPSPSAPAQVTFVEITGEGIGEPIVLSSERHGSREQAVRAEVEFLTGKDPIATTPDPATVGPKYTVKLLTMGQPTAVYDVYPLSPGGPRVFRPANQPGGDVAEGWFYGRLSMPTSLLRAGVPIPGATPDPGFGGGQGGGSTASPPPDLGALMKDWQRYLGINIAAAIIVAAGVFALAYMLRRQS